MQDYLPLQSDITCDLSNQHPAAHLPPAERLRRPRGGDQQQGRGPHRARVAAESLLPPRRLPQGLRRRAQVDTCMAAPLQGNKECSHSLCS